MKAINLREAIYHILSEVSHGRHPDDKDLDTLNASLSDFMAKTRVGRRDGSFTWEWTGDRYALDRMLGPIARSTADLLTSEDLNRVGECADQSGCGWLFLDTSRNRSRRWCSMGSCGNRAKAKRHYQRSKE
jgi:predicted RNA-binding Zn ribbon-like protein